MAQQRGFEPPNRSCRPPAFQAGATTIITLLQIFPAQPFSNYFIGADRTESRKSREHVADVLWRQEWDSNPQGILTPSVFGTDWLPLPHPAIDIENFYYIRYNY